MPCKEQYSGLSKRELAFVKVAVSLAGTSYCRNKHGAVIVSGGRVIATGVNSFRNDPMVEPIRASEHAEIAALRQLRFRVPKRATIFIGRVNKYGEHMLSRPCSECYAELRRVSIREVIYTT